MRLHEFYKNIPEEKDKPTSGDRNIALYLPRGDMKVLKAEDKDYVNVVDITSDLKYSKRHLTKRKAFYREQNFRHTVTKVNYKNEV